MHKGNGKKSNESSKETTLEIYTNQGCAWRHQVARLSRAIEKHSKIGSGEISEHKSRLNAHGVKQQYGLNWYAPVVTRTMTIYRFDRHKNTYMVSSIAGSV